MATEYRQKLAIINAIQYDGTNAQGVISFGNGKITDDGGKLMLSHYPDDVMSAPSEIKVTDWVIKGPTQVISSMPDSYFSQAYEPNV